MIVLPPEGAARQVGLDLLASAQASPDGGACVAFDTKAYLDGFKKLLREPDDDMRVDLTNQALIVSALDHAVTHLLVIALAPITYFTLRLLQKQGIKTLHWFIEDFRQAAYWRQVLPAYHAFCAIQRGPLEIAGAEAGIRFHFLPTACGPMALSASRQGKAWSLRLDALVFIGLPSAYRVRVLEALMAAGAVLGLAGTGWSLYQGPLSKAVIRDTVNSEESTALLSQYRYGLHLPYEDPAADRAQSHVSPRVYELMALGCIPLIESGPLLRECLAETKVKWFEGPEEAVNAWRTRETLTSGQAESNQAWVHGRHGYAQRWLSLQALASDLV